MSSLTPAERVLRARMASYRSWANTKDRSARTANARKASDDRFEREVDPEGTLPEKERLKRAEAARKAYYLNFALKGSKAAREKAQTKRAAS